MKSFILKEINQGYGNRYLYDAIRHNDIEKVKFLIENGVDVNEKNLLGKTPLYEAASSGYLELVKFLVEKGADVNAKTNNGVTALHDAAYNGYLEIEKFLVEKGADINAKTNSGRTPLHEAASGNKLEALKFLVEKNADVNAKTNDGVTPLHEAATSGNIIIIHLLVKKGADVNAKNNKGLTPFEIAIRLRHEAAENLLRFLIEQPPERIIEDKVVEASNPEYLKELGEHRIVCPVCLTNEKKIALSCGHMVCAKCSKEIKDRDNKCPICRKPIETRQELFYKKYLKYKNKYLTLKNTL